MPDLLPARYTLEKVHNHCILYEDCDLHDESCTTCATGPKYCSHGYHGMIRVCDISRRALQTIGLSNFLVEHETIFKKSNLHELLGSMEGACYKEGEGCGGHEPGGFERLMDYRIDLWETNTPAA